MDDADEIDGEDPERRRRRRRRRWIWLSIVLVLLALICGAVAAGIVFAQQAFQVRDDLSQAREKIAQVVPLVQAGDTAQVEQLSTEITALTASANKTASNDLWSFASAIPWVGANVTAVSETTKAVHVLVQDAMPIALDLLTVADVDNFKVEGGGINLEPFRAAMPQIPALRAAFDEAKSHVDKIDRAEIHPLVEENIGQLVDIIDEATPALAFAEEQLPIVIGVLGGDGPRNYALLFQNNAEIRATGGNPGAGAVLKVDNGKVTMRDDPAALSFMASGPRGYYPQSLDDPSKMGIFEPDTWKYSQNYTRTPDFADTADLMGGLWSKTVGGKLDGIISLDPVTLSYMLKVAGPVAVPGESAQVTADNAVKLLLSDSYERFGGRGDLADVYFAGISAAVFSKVMGGGWEPLAMLEQLQKAADEQRVYAWFADPAEEAMAAELGIDGPVLDSAEKETQLGIYLNDSSHSKLEYYLSNKITVTCSTEKRTVTTSIAMKNSVPSANLSDYTLGARNRSWGYPRTTMFLDVIGMSVPGGKLTSTNPAAGDRDGWDRSGVYNTRETRSLFVTIPMGESRTVSFTSTVPEGAASALDVRYSPTVTQTPVTVDASCEQLFPGSTTAK